jgi:hypothetical protein
MAEKKIVASMDEIAASSDVEYATVEGFSKDSPIRIGSLTAGDLIEWSEANESEEKRTAGLRLITKSLVGPEPENLRYAMGAAEEKNIAILRTKSHKVTERIVREVLKMNGMTVKEDANAKKE